MARRRPPRGRRPPARARLACLAALLALAALAALPTARAQLATEDLYDPEAPADADGTADGAGSLDANATEADYGGTGDGTGTDSVEPLPSYEEIVRELLNPTEEEVVAEPPPSLDLNALGLETVFPDSPFVGDGVSVRTGKTFSDLEQDLIELEKQLGAADVGAGNGTAGEAVANETNATGTDANDANDANDATDADGAGDASVGETSKFDARAFLYDEKTEGDAVDPRLACKRGCVDPTVDVNLVWCLDAVKYKYCNRVVTDKPTVAVLDMEEAAIAAYMALAQRVPTPNAPECRPMLRKWMCYEFFMRCNTDETAYYPVCATTCAAAKYACGSPDFIECDQEVEELDGDAPDEWYTNADRVNGKYIRGVKPDGREGSPVFETDVLRCTGGASGLTRSGAAVASLFAACLVVAFRRDVFS